MNVLTTEQEDRIVTDPWEDILREYLYGTASGIENITALQIMANVLEIPMDRRDRASQTKIGRIMRDLGWKRERFREGDERSYRYVRPQ